MIDTVVLCERWLKMLTNLKKKKEEKRNGGNLAFICIALDRITYLCRETETHKVTWNVMLIERETISYTP